MGKRIMATIVVIGLVLVLILTNPSQTQYSAFIREKVVEGLKGDPLLAIVGSAVAGFSVNTFTDRHNYVLFSLFTTKNIGQQITVLGILDNFIVIKSVPQ